MVINVDMTDVVNDYVYRQTMVTNEVGEIMAVRPPEEDEKFQYAMTPQGVIRRVEMPRWYQWLARRCATLYYLERELPQTY